MCEGEEGQEMHHLMEQAPDSPGPVKIAVCCLFQVTIVETAEKVAEKPEEPMPFSSPGQCGGGESLDLAVDTTMNVMIHVDGY